MNTGRVFFLNALLNHASTLSAGQISMKIIISHCTYRLHKLKTKYWCLALGSGPLSQNVLKTICILEHLVHERGTNDYCIILILKENVFICQVPKIKVPNYYPTLE